jgi:hypothetical protein
MDRPPNSMSLFSNSKLLSAWFTRSGEIDAQRLQDSSDLLYNHLRREFVSRRQSLQTDLLEVIKTAASPRDLQIPLWTFHTSFVPQLSREDYAKVQGHLRRYGYEWSIGLVDNYFDPERTEVFEWGWQWKSRPVTIHQIVNYTDLLPRLALLFGLDFHVVATRVAVKSLSDPADVKVYKTELQLRYYPKGLPRALWDKQVTVREKYADYAAPVHEANVHLWTGVPSVVEAPSTPPPAPAAEAPPLLPQRSNGGGIDLSSVGDVSRRLDFNESGIYTYEGEDALERAARDMVSGTVCHCDYHHEW